MAFVIKDRVRESTATTGTGAFTLGGAISGYRSFSSVMINGDTTWYACILPGGAWEVGVGTWVTGNTLQRTTLYDSSTGSAISFAAGTKDIFIALPAAKGNVLNNAFAPGTLMLFQQTNAPVYWTKQVTHNDKALRVVSGAASAGGTNAFSTAFNSSNVVGNTTITTATMPSHSHGHNMPAHGDGGGIPGGGAFRVNQFGTGGTINSNGSDGPHNHAYNIAVQYVDLIIASKD